MTLSQPLYSFPRLAFSIITKKNCDLSQFQSFSLKIENLYADESQLEKFKQQFGEPDNIPTFAFITAFKASLQCLSQAPIPSSIMGLIHLTSEFETITKHNWYAPFDLTINVSECLKTDKGLQYTVISEFSQHGEITIINTNTMLDKKKGYKKDKDSTSSANVTVPTQENISTWQIKQTTAWQYARLSGDYNPIHLHSSLARMLGLKSVLIHGMYNASQCLSTLINNNGALDSKISIAFNKPCFIPNTACLKAYEKTGEFGLFSEDGEDRFLKIKIGNEQK